MTGTWKLSLDALAAQGREQAGVLLQVLSCFAGGVRVPPSLLNPAVLSRLCGGSADVDDGLSGLLAVGLIESSTLGRRQDGRR